MGGKCFRWIYSTNDQTKLVIIDESEDRDGAYLQDQVVSLITNILDWERKLIEKDVENLNNRS